MRSIGFCSHSILGFRPVTSLKNLEAEDERERALRVAEAGVHFPEAFIPSKGCVAGYTRSAMT